MRLVFHLLQQFFAVSAAFRDTAVLLKLVAIMDILEGIGRSVLNVDFLVSFRLCGNWIAFKQVTEIRW